VRATQLKCELGRSNQYLCDGETHKTSVLLQPSAAQRMYDQSEGGEL